MAKQTQWVYVYYRLWLAFQMTACFTTYTNFAQSLSSTRSTVYNSYISRTSKGNSNKVIIPSNTNSTNENKAMQKNSKTANTPSTSSSSNTSTNQIHTLILCRHGDSIWNGGQPGLKETFTGWTDVPLSQKGINEASNTGKQLSSYYTYGIDACFTSTLCRAKQTAHYCTWAYSNQHHETEPKKYFSDYRLNERHYGSLQGYVKHDVENGIVLDYTIEQVNQWRRNWYAVPPLLDDDDPRRIDEIRKWSNFCGGVDNVPRGESLEMVANNRIRPFLDDVLNPFMEEVACAKSIDDQEEEAGTGGEGGTALVIAHANSLRALIGIICQVENDDAALKKLEAMKIQTGVPLILRYQKLDNGNYRACTIPEIVANDYDAFKEQQGTRTFQAKTIMSGIQQRTQIQTMSKPDLPVWPLSCLPKNRKDDISPTSIKNVFDKKPIRIDVI